MEFTVCSSELMPEEALTWKDMSLPYVTHIATL